jgi:hypothetical protein
MSNPWVGLGRTTDQTMATYAEHDARIMANVMERIG